MLIHRPRYVSMIIVSLMRIQWWSQQIFACQKYYGQMESMRRTKGQITHGYVRPGRTASVSSVPWITHGLVAHVFIDDVMRDTSVNVRVLWSTYMINESYQKFTVEPFELVYRNATVNQNGEETRWAEGCLPKYPLSR